MGGTKRIGTKRTGGTSRIGTKRTGVTFSSPSEARSYPLFAHLPGEKSWLDHHLLAMHLHCILLSDFCTQLMHDASMIWKWFCTAAPPPNRIRLDEDTSSTLGAAGVVSLGLATAAFLLFSVFTGIEPVAEAEQVLGSATQSVKSVAKVAILPPSLFPHPRDILQT